MHDLIGTLGRVYSLAWWLLYQLANPLVLWGLIVLMALYAWLSLGDPLLGFPTWCCWRWRPTPVACF